MQNALDLYMALYERANGSHTFCRVLAGVTPASALDYKIKYKMGGYMWMYVRHLNPLSCQGNWVDSLKNPCTAIALF